MKYTRLCNSILSAYCLFFSSGFLCAEVTYDSGAAMFYTEPSIVNCDTTSQYCQPQISSYSESPYPLADNSTKQLMLALNRDTNSNDRGLRAVRDKVSEINQRFALIIGNGNYQNSPLRNPVNDASDMAQVLQNLNFQVTLLLDATHKDTIEYIHKFTNTLKESNGVGLFYYAGHGMQVDGNNYLIPVDASIQQEYQVESEGIQINRVLRGMENAGNVMNIVILDACRDNPYSRSFRSTARGLAQMDAPSGTLIAYATAPGSVANDGNGRNGLYTKHLLKEMTAPDLTLEHALKRVRSGVMHDTNKQQVPWESSSLVGEFCFSGPCGDGATYRPSVDDNNTPVMPSNDWKGFEYKADKPWYKQWYTWTAAAVLIAILASSCSGGEGGTDGAGGSGGGCSF